MPANAQPTRPNYSVKNAETVAAGKDLRVRLFTLVPALRYQQPGFFTPASPFKSLISKQTRPISLGTPWRWPR